MDVVFGENGKECSEVWYFSCFIDYYTTVNIFSSDLWTEPKGQLLLINGKTDDEVCRSLERVLLTMRITSSEPKVWIWHRHKTASLNYITVPLHHFRLYRIGNLLAAVDTFL